MDDTRRGRLRPANLVGQVAGRRAKRDSAALTRGDVRTRPGIWQARQAELLAELGEPDTAVHGPRPASGALHRLSHLRLGLDELIALRIADLLLRKVDHAQ